MGALKAEEQANRILKYVDMDNSGLIQYSEFVAACLNKNNMLT